MSAHKLHVLASNDNLSAASRGVGLLGQCLAHVLLVLLNMSSFAHAHFSFTYCTVLIYYKVTNRLG